MIATFADRVLAFADRFISDRSFTLIVEPALADFEFDDRPARPLASYGAVLRAVAGACYEDTVGGGNAGTFATLTLLPIAYYTVFFFLCAQNLGPLDSWRDVGIFIVALIPLSVAPAIACFWPERRPRRLPEV